MISPHKTDSSENIQKSCASQKKIIWQFQLFLVFLHFDKKSPSSKGSKRFPPKNIPKNNLQNDPNPSRRDVLASGLSLWHFSPDSNSILPLLLGLFWGENSLEFRHFESLENHHQIIRSISDCQIISRCLQSIQISKFLDGWWLITDYLRLHPNLKPSFRLILWLIYIYISDHSWIFI